MAVKVNKRISHYKTTIAKWIKHRAANILVVAGGKTDCEVFSGLGFQNVTISNVDKRDQGDEYYPFKWSYQNAENLSFAENAFDFVVVHAGLHHCYSPHLALLNMYRVAKRGVIIFESRDSFIVRFIANLGLTHTYEHAAVYLNDCKCGGVENTDIPNYVYRWTEREIEKTINSYAPYARHHICYSYSYDIPRASLRSKKGKWKKVMVYLLLLNYALFVRVFPKQQNLFACFISKPNLDAEHFEWLKIQEKKIVFNKEWAENYYKKV